ncbi:MAG: CHAD domain-containing protein [Candidatus Eremiobacteraeota bacterium]|nr:CHAD domain-containing protein [Candidatus Eremiobacteraeota bacterium]MBV9056390.1 CHAD domain-containing protein [Candidatus Eremiobacteraeota bacterium]
MKPQVVELRGVTTARELARRVIGTRAQEVGRLAAAFEGREKAQLHDFRIACKRLRYALERFSALEPSLEAASQQFALLQDALGEAHDRDVLLTILPPAMGETQRRLQLEREVCVIAAAAMWEALKEPAQRLLSHHF